MSEKENINETVWLNDVSEKLIGEAHSTNKPYLREDGTEYTPMIQNVRLNFGTSQEPKWGSIAIESRQIQNAKIFKAGDIVGDKEGFKNIALSSDYWYTVQYNGVKTGEVDENGKDIYSNPTEKLTGFAIKEIYDANQKAYRQSQKEDSKEEVEVTDVPVASEQEKEMWPALFVKDGTNKDRGKGMFINQPYSATKKDGTEVVRRTIHSIPFGKDEEGKTMFGQLTVPASNVYESKGDDKQFRVALPGDWEVTVVQKVSGQEKPNFVKMKFGDLVNTCNELKREFQKSLKDKLAEAKEQVANQTEQNKEVPSKEER